ncbi:MAG: NERD domain-containing protein [Gammaproteobacteria bacterium]|nr:NERD domain-containing protein [Gammaproteobacteria bacterium]MCF6258567.1 NERD domain-containing protein [Gammaproteobacteria bacterium]
MESVSIEVVFYILEAIAALGLLAVIFFFWKQSRKNKHQRHAHKVVDSLGVKYLRNVVLPDGIDGLVFIDYLLLVPGGFVVLDTQHSEGHLFGGETIDQWSQVINNKTYKFNNPLYDNQRACQAIQWNLQHTIKAENSPADTYLQIHGWVAFSSAGNFPKGIPAQVSMVDELKNNLAPLINKNNSIDEHLQKTWQALHQLSITTQAENKP